MSSTSASTTATNAPVPDYLHYKVFDDLDELTGPDDWMHLFVIESSNIYIVHPDKSSNWKVPENGCEFLIDMKIYPRESLMKVTEQEQMWRAAYRAKI